jgi:hypothetical protein
MDTLTRLVLAVTEEEYQVWYAGARLVLADLLEERDDPRAGLVRRRLRGPDPALPLPCIPKADLYGLTASGFRGFVTLLDDDGEVLQVIAASPRLGAGVGGGPILWAAESRLWAAADGWPPPEAVLSCAWAPRFAAPFVDHARFTREGVSASRRNDVLGAFREIPEVAAEIRRPGAPWVTHRFLD